MKILITTIMLLMPQALMACSVCFTGREGFMEAFYATTVLLIALPPALLGSIGYYIYRGHKKNLKAAADAEKN
ncbi:MAG: hypothetical protein QNL04_14400 [SAR324 cluster bacterium]|nr:hypothetical protein [SAR324 cluster bacterium]